MDQILPATSNAPFVMAIIATVISGVVLLLDIPPLVWHIRHRNLGAGSLIGWLLILNLMTFTNALIWPNDNLNEWWHGHGLCDVEVRIKVGASNALPGALTCIMRHLAAVLDTENIIPSMKTKRLSHIIDLILCFGIPVLSMIALYLVQDLRYYLTGISGCSVSVDNSWPSLITIYLWPLILTLLAAYYAGVVIFRIYRYRREFKSILASRNTTQSRFLRLFLMAGFIVLGILPLQAYVLIVNSTQEMQIYDWDRVHKGTWTKIVGVPSSGIVRWDEWIVMAAGLLVFFFFGIGADARAMYQAWIVRLGGFGSFQCLKKGTRGTKRHYYPSRSPHSSSGNTKMIEFLAGMECGELSANTSQHHYSQDATIGSNFLVSDAHASGGQLCQIEFSHGDMEPENKDIRIVGLV